MLFPFVQGLNGLAADYFAVNPQAHKTLHSRIGQQITVFAAAIHQQGYQQVQAGAGWQAQQLPSDMLGRLVLHLAMAHMAVLDTNPGI